jgi:hypothetical protein
MDVSPAMSAAALPAFRGWSTRAWSFTVSPKFGDYVIVLFFVAQALDGALTYVGVQSIGREIEGNPLLFWLMGVAGHGPGLALAKLVAAGFGMVLHLTGVHRAVALLTMLYVSAAVIPWIAVLTFAVSKGLL